VIAENRRFVVRRQEFAGTTANTVTIVFPIPLKSAELVNLTEEKLLRSSLLVNPLTVAIKPNETLSIRVEIQKD
jgi:hypothetical protein